MATAITMPRLGLSMVEGTVTEWRAGPGEAVAKGQLILTIESEKAEVEVEAFASGTLAAIYVETGKTVPIGTLLAAIASPDEAFDAAAFAASFVPEREGAPATAGPTRTAAVTPAGGATPVAPAGAEGIKAAPAARSLAKKLGIDLATVAGTGPGGRILPEDVEKTAASLVAVNGVRLAAAKAGSGPPLLLVCGFGVDASGWRRQVDGLSPAHTVMTYDHRGVGGSQRISPAGVSLADLADDAAAIAAHFAAAPAIVVGASMGAAVALELALRHPGIVRGLVLVSPVLERDARFEAVLRSWSETAEPESAERIRGMLPWLLGRAFLANAGKRAAAAAALRAMAAHTPPDTLKHHAAALLSWLGTRSDDLVRVETPSLVIVGAEDILAPPAQAEAVARGLRNARLETFPEAGHAVMIEQADELNRRIRDFAAALAG